MAPQIIKRAKRLIKESTGPLVRRYTSKRTDLPEQLWRLKRDVAGILQIDGIALSALQEQYGSPLQLVDAAKLDQNIADFLAKPVGAAQSCETFYSYKTNPVPAVLDRMHRRGIGAEVISEYELWLALQLGVAPEKIVYNGPAKSPASLSKALDAGIGLLNFNSHEEIAPYAALARSKGKRQRVGVRIAVPGGWSGQFGEQISTGAALHAFKQAMDTPELQVVALHAHRGGEIATSAQLATFASHVLAFSDQLYERLGLELEILDFGGSLACPTTRHFSEREIRLNTTFYADLLPRSPQTVLSIREYCRQLTSIVEQHYRQRGRAVPRIFLEPGRALTGNTQMLLAQVMVTRHQPDGLSYAVLDAGINIAESVRSEYHQLFYVPAPRSSRKQLYRLAGPICTPADVLYQAWLLPELSAGDSLAIMDSGAYFVPFSTSFSFPQPAIVLLEHGETRIIRRAEQFSDLVALDQLPLAQRDMAPAS